MSMKSTHRRGYPTAPLAGATRWAATVLGGLVLLGGLDAAAQMRTDRYRSRLSAIL
jgi:hypothetical protein